jgi:phosphoribosylformimino-5-aminoimidazole carboxamide ribotide isomerase
MLIIPAVDLRAGRCVRLLQGRAEAETVFRRSGGHGPAVAVRRRAAPHVSIWTALGGGPAQTAIIRDIACALATPVDVAGALPSSEHIEPVLEAAARWAIVGTRAALDPVFLGEVCRRFADRIIVGVDASDGRVAVDGWTRVLDLEAVALARDAAAAGACTIIYTDIARDGTQSGPNVWSTEAVARAAGIPVFASGGVGSLEDIRQLAGIPGVDGVVVGRALYTGALTLSDALAEAG